MSARRARKPKPAPDTKSIPEVACELEDLANVVWMIAYWLAWQKAVAT